MEAYFSFAPIHESKSLWNMFPNIGDEVKTLTQSSPSLIQIMLFKKLKHTI